jgi:uncharacterized protein YcfJ
VQDTPNLALGPTIAARRAPSTTAQAALRAHSPEYLMEAVVLGVFMVSACLFGVLYEFPHSPVRQPITSSLIRRMLMGISMDLGQSRSPILPGESSRAHTSILQSLSRCFVSARSSAGTPSSIVAQFIGSALGAILGGVLFMNQLSDPAVRYIATVPGKLTGGLCSPTPNNLEAHGRLQAKLKQAMKQTGRPIHGHDCHQRLFGRNLYVGQRIALAGVAHQNGRIRFGHRPKMSVLNSKAHDLDNLYVVDGRFFTSSAAVYPALNEHGECVARWRSVWE